MTSSISRSISRNMSQSHYFAVTWSIFDYQFLYYIIEVSQGFRLRHSTPGTLKPIFGSFFLFSFFAILLLKENLRRQDKFNVRCFDNNVRYFSSLLFSSLLFSGLPSSTFSFPSSPNISRRIIAAILFSNLNL